MAATARFEPAIRSDQLTRLWFFADEDGSGRIDLFEFMRMIGGLVEDLRLYRLFGAAWDAKMRNPS